MTDPLAGKTLRWKFRDGPMAGKEYEHAFGKDGTVQWSPAAGPAPGPESHARYELAKVGTSIVAFSYLSPSGHTLTSLLDLRAGSVVAFASNEKELVLQHGRFEFVSERPERPANDRALTSKRVRPGSARKPRGP